MITLEKRQNYSIRQIAAKLLKSPYSEDFTPATYAEHIVYSLIKQAENNAGALKQLLELLDETEEKKDIKIKVEVVE